MTRTTAGLFLLLAAAILCTIDSVDAATDDGSPNQSLRKLLRPRGHDDDSDVGSTLKGYWASGNNKAAATAMATAGSSGWGSATTAAAATACVDAAASGAYDALAETFAWASAANVDATAAVMAKAATESKSRGDSDWQAFARSQARGFAMASSTGNLESYASAVATAMNKGSDRDTVVQTYGVAFAQAAASGGAEGQALAQATAIAFCEGGSMASAFAEAYSEAISRNAQGCQVLTRARVIAIARCNAGGAFSSAQSSITTEILGKCRLNRRRSRAGASSSASATGSGGSYSEGDK